MRPCPAQLTFRLLLPALLLLFAMPAAIAQSADPVLGGLKGVELGVELQHDTESRLGLSGNRAYRVIEEELRKAGVRFLTPPEMGMDVGSRFRRMPKGYALLFFQVATVADDRLGGYAVDISFQLLDRVRLARDSSKETVAPLYRGRHLVLMRGGVGGEEAERRLRALAKEFAADFKASNPEKAQGLKTNRR